MPKRYVLRCEWNWVLGAVRLYERLDILREEVMDGRNSEMIGRTSGASRFDIDKFSEVLGL